jgi:hypothetical protein
MFCFSAAPLCWKNLCKGFVKCVIITLPSFMAADVQLQVVSHANEFQFTVDPVLVAQSSMAFLL